MMVLSRIWYVILSLLLGVALYVVYLAVGQYNRRNSVAMAEELASDSQTVGWALQIDARKRLDALLIGSVDKAIQDALQGANGKDPILAKVKDDGRKALLAVLDKIPVDFRPDALFAVDHDGRVVAQVGFDQANAYPDFELGGYPAVFDALHGYLRDDTWVLGGKIYRVVARPVEFDVTQPPIGAVVALRSVDKKFAQDLSKRTRANIAFYAAGQRVVSATLEGFDENQLDLIAGDLPKIGADKSYGDGRSDVRFIADDVGVMYARLFGDAWELGAGFVVARGRIAIAGPLGFLSGADDKDKQSVPFAILALAVVIGILGGMLLSLLEHGRPLKEMVGQASKLRRGELDYLQLPRFRGRYRAIAADINAGIERVLEKGGGGAARKPADLESILGPVPAQPAMSAFSFPLADSGGGPGPGPAPRPGGFPPPAPSGPGRDPVPTRPGGPPKPAPPPFAADPPMATLATPPPIQPIQPLQGPPIPPIQGHPPVQGPPPSAGAYAPGPGAFAKSGTGPAYAAAGGYNAAPPAPAPSPFLPPPRTAAFMPAGLDHGPADMEGPTMAAPAPADSGHTPSGVAAVQGLRGAGAPGAGPQRHGAPTMMGIQPPPPRAVPAAPAQGVALAGNNPFAVPTTPQEFFPPPRPQPAPAPQRSPAAAGPSPASAGNRALVDAGDEGEDEATVVAPAPSDLLAAATGDNKAVGDESAEWMGVYEEFVRTKKQCGEPTDGLTFEKFQHTLKKNRDALIQRHNCKRVRFSVYIKEGRASLKATPVRE